jgi:DNA mismatch repair protein MutS2
MDPHTLDILEFPKVREIVAEFAASAPGKARALQMTPVTAPGAVRKVLEQTAEMTDLIARGRAAPLPGLRDVRGILEKSVEGKLLTAEELARVSETLYVCLRVRIWLDKLPVEREYPRMKELGRGVARFGDLSDEIDKAVAGDGRIHDSASDRLLKLRTEIESMKAQMADKIRRFVQAPSIRQYLQFPEPTWSGDRYVLAVKADHRGRVPGIVHRSSGTGETLFVEPAGVVELGNAVVELIDHEQQEITRILRELTRKVASVADSLRGTLETLCDLDAVNARARYSLEYRCVCPEISGDRALLLRAARHPILLYLQRRAAAGAAPAGSPRPPAEVVPIDVRLGEEFDLLIVTGPNTGGKTAALKTVGLFVVMAQCGLHVPAGHGARLPVFIDVFADIGDEQSLEQSLSTFSGHVKRIAEILAKAGEDSLVLLDELGSGTDPAEGASLGRAILDELLRLRCRAVVTTHLGALKTYAYTTDRAENASVEFDVQTLRPTYRLLIGEPGNSNALTIAERLGLNAGVVFRARRYLSEQDRRLTETIDHIRDRRRSAELAKQAADESRAAAEQTRLEYEKKLAAITEKKKQDEDRDKWRSKLQPGDRIFVPRFKSTGQFLRYVGSAKSEAVVQVGYIEARLPVAQVYPPDEAAG